MTFTNLVYSSGNLTGTFFSSTTTTPPFILYVKVNSTSAVTLGSSNIVYSSQAINYNFSIPLGTISPGTPLILVGGMSSPSNIVFETFNYSIPSTTTTTFTGTKVTIQAPNGKQGTFTVLASDWTAYQTTHNLTVINLINLQNQTSVPNTITDINNFINANQIITSTNITDFRITSQSGNSVSFAWTPLSAATGGYQIRTIVNGVLTVPTSPGAGISTTTLNLTYPAGTYDFWLTPLTISGFGTDSNHISVTLVSNTFDTVTVTIKAINGNQQSFTVKSTDWTAFQLSGGISGATVVNLVTNHNQTSAPNTINDIGNFLTSNTSGGTTPPPPTPTPAPTVSTPIVSGSTVTINYSSTGTAILITRNGTPISNTATQLSGTLTDSGLANGTYQYTFVASNVGVQSTPVSVQATINVITPPSGVNFVLSISIPNQNLRTIMTPSEHTAFVSAIQNNTLSQLLADSKVPNSLAYQEILQNVTDASNWASIQGIIKTYYDNVTITTKRNILETAGGIFAGLITLSLFSGNNPKGNKKR